MKTAQQWFDEYAISHQNKKNQYIHFICVPLIFFSVIGLLMSIPSEFLAQNIPFYNPLLENWAVVFLIIALFFYTRLGFWNFTNMFVISLFSIFLNYMISTLYNLAIISTIIFVLAWIGQFYGHKLEGKKPSFLKDLQFLLIGPLWVIKKISK